MLLAVAAAAPAGGSAAGPQPPAALRGTTCVEPADVMRRDHMRFLTHQRDVTVHRGIRGAKHSLAGCIGCHAQRDAAGNPVPVDAPGQFCAACHAFAAVRIDCFECHAATPAPRAVSGGGQP